MAGESGGRPEVVLDPAVQRLIEASAAPPYLDRIGPLDGRRALEESQSAAAADPAISAEFQVAPVGPSGLVGFWVFRPVRRVRPARMVVFVHGGRWMLGDARTHSRLIHRLVALTGEALVVPEFTRTPEARYPVAVEEIYALLDWLAGNAAGLGLDPARPAIAGDCAGATMATAVTMMAKDRSGPRISGQLLYYPMLDARCDSPSQSRYGTGFLLTRDAVRWYWDQYCDDPRELTEPTASPARASLDQLAGLPPAMVVTAEADPTRDEAEAYADRLRTAGVEVTAVRYLGTVHDFVSLAPLRRMPSALAAVRQGAGFLREALRPDE